MPRWLVQFLMQLDYQGVYRSSSRACASRREPYRFLAQQGTKISFSPPTSTRSPLSFRCSCYRYGSR